MSIFQKLRPLQVGEKIVDANGGVNSTFNILWQQLFQNGDFLDGGKADKTTQMIAGGGLTGGGDLSADRTFNVGAGAGITVNADDVAIDLTAEAERIRDVMGVALVAGSGVTITPDDGADTITIDATGTGGTVTSVAMTVPTGLSVAGSPITGSGTFAVTLASGYAIPTTAKQTDWDTAFGWGNHATAGYLTGIPAGSIGATELASTAVTPGTYGDASNVPQITVDADGRITAATNVAVSGGGGSGGVLPMVDGSIPPVFIQNPDGSLVYTPI